MGPLSQSVVPVHLLKAKQDLRAQGAAEPRAVAGKPLSEPSLGGEPRGAAGTGAVMGVRQPHSASRKLPWVLVPAAWGAYGSPADSLLT